MQIRASEHSFRQNLKHIQNTALWEAESYNTEGIFRTSSSKPLCASHRHFLIQAYSNSNEKSAHKHTQRTDKTPKRSPDSPVWRVKLCPQFTAVQTSRIRVTKCKHITRGRGVSFWLGGGGAAHQRIVFYLNLGCSGLAGRPPMHCPVLHSPSPSLHAARWTDGPTDRWMDGWKDDGDIRESAKGEKHVKLENRETVYFGTVMSLALHRNYTLMLKQ